MGLNKDWDGRGGGNGWKHLVRLWWQWTIHGSVWLWCPCPSLASTKTPRNANLCHVQVVSRTSSYSHLFTYLTLILLTAATPSPSPSPSHHFTSLHIPSHPRGHLNSGHHPASTPYKQLGELLLELYRLDDSRLSFAGPPTRLAECQTDQSCGRIQYRQWLCLLKVFARSCTDCGYMQKRLTALRGRHRAINKY